jgi:hypothetical protein
MTYVLTGPRRSGSLQASGFGFPNLLSEGLHFAQEFFEAGDRCALSFQLLKLDSQHKQVWLNALRLF